MNLRDIFLAGAFAQGGGGAVSPEQITEAVNNYLDKNPVESYTLPVGGDTLGGVKNGGNVVINADGTMDAPEASGSGGGSEEAELLYESTDVEVRSVKQWFEDKHKKYIIWVRGKASAGSTWAMKGLMENDVGINIYLTTQVSTHAYGSQTWFAIDVAKDAPPLFSRCGNTGAGDGASQWYGSVMNRMFYGFELSANDASITYDFLDIKVWGVKA